jgi:hypothetical protein
MLNVIMPSSIIMSAILLIVIMLSAVMLIAIIVIMRLIHTVASNINAKLLSIISLR